MNANGNPLEFAASLANFTRTELMDLHAAFKNQMTDHLAQNDETMRFFLLENHLVAHGFLNKEEAVYGRLMR